jgi:hypothetical protein
MLDPKQPATFRATLRAVGFVQLVTAVVAALPARPSLQTILAPWGSTSAIRALAATPSDA